MMKMESKYSKLIDELKPIAILSVILVVFMFILFGIMGARVILGFSLLFFLPFYIILSNFDISVEEKAIFSLLLGIGIFPTISHYLGMIFSSMKIAIVTSFVLLMAIGIAFNRYYPKLKKNKEDKE